MVIVKRFLFMNIKQLTPNGNGAFATEDLGVKLQDNKFEVKINATDATAIEISIVTLTFCQEGKTFCRINMDLHKFTVIH